MSGKAKLPSQRTEGANIFCVRSTKGLKWPRILMMSPLWGTILVNCESLQWYL